MGIKGLRKLGVVVGLLMQVFLLEAQVQLEYKPGYVVTQKNDTVFGALKHLPYPSLISKVVFRSKEALEDTTYTTNAIKSFHFEPNVTFEAIEIASIKQKDTTNRSYFALRRLTGPVDFLIVYMPNSEERYFVRSEKYGLSELKQPIETVNNQVFSNKRYLSVLSKYLGEVPEFQSKIENCGYYEGSFVKLVSSYNDRIVGVKTCEPKKKLNYDLLVNVGLGQSLISLIDSKRLMPGVNLGLEASFSDKEKNMRSEFVVGLNYRALASGYSYQITSTLMEKQPNAPQLRAASLTVETAKVVEVSQALGLPVFIRYNNREKMFSPVLEGGVEPYLMVNYKNDDHLGLYRSKVIVDFDLLLGVGVAINRPNYRLKYMVYADLNLWNALSIQFTI